MKIIYWSDYACPFCYIGKERLKKALKNLNLEADLIMKAFQLDPKAAKKAVSDTKTRFAQKYGLSLEEAEQRIEAISRMGRAEGLDFNYKDTLFTNTMDAHRLTKYAQNQDPKLAQNLVEALFKAYFSDNLELSDKTLLLKIAKDCGLNPEETKEVLESDKFKEEVILDEREAQRYEIYSVPFFVVGQYGVSGAQSVENLELIIKKALEEDKNFKNLSEGVSCGIDGCKVGEK